MSSETPSSRGLTGSSGMESTESTVPTDLTLSPSDPTMTAAHERVVGRQNRHPNAGHQAVTRQAYERKQLLHDLQLIKIELSQKTLLMDSLKAQHMARTEELEEKLADAIHQSQISKARLESQLQLEREETRRRLNENRTEIDRIRVEQKRLEARNEQLEGAANDLKGRLRDIDTIADDQYFALQTQDADKLSLKDYISVKIYEMTWSLKNETVKLKTKIKTANDENKKLSTTCDQLEEERLRERQQFAHLMSKYNRVVSDLELAKSQIHSGDYKLEHYDAVKSERDKLMQECLELRNSTSVLNAENAGQKKELEEMKSEQSNRQQKISLLTQDKEFLGRQLAELKSRNYSLEERLATSTLQLEKVTQAREDVYERYVSARDFYKTEFERRLKEELDGIQLKTSTEIETLRRAAKEMHEQEIRSLKDARDLAVSQRDKSETAERQALSKYERLLDEIRKAQNDDTSVQSSLRNQLTLRTFELEKTKLLHAEIENNCHQVQLENEKLRKKVEILSEEFRALQVKLQSQVVDLESQIKDKSSRLSVYEKMEQELDDVVVQAAEIAGDGDGDGAGEKLLLSFGREIGIPTTIRRRIQQSFQLAKRILLLEKSNAMLKKRLEEQKSELENYAELLDKVGKPQSTFVETIQSRDRTIKDHRQQIVELENNIKEVTREKQEILKKNEVTIQELAKARNNREEVAKMKQLLITLFPDRFKSTNGIIQNVPYGVRRTEGTDTHRANIGSKTTTTTTQPKATIFTKARKTYNKPP